MALGPIPLQDPSTANRTRPPHTPRQIFRLLESGPDFRLPEQGTPPNPIEMAAAAAATFACPRPVSRSATHPETDDALSQFQSVVKRVHAFEQSARDLRTVPVNRRHWTEAFDRIEKRTDEARRRFQLFNESLTADAIRQDNVLFSKASHASAILESDDELTGALRQLDVCISQIEAKIARLKASSSSSVGMGEARLAERKLRLVENDIVNARQRISEADRQFRQVKSDFDQCVKGNRLQTIVMKSMERDMGKIRHDVNDLVDRLQQARDEIARGRIDLDAQREIGEKQVIQFQRDWDCLKTFESNNPALQHRFEIFNEIRRLHEESTRSQRAVAKKLDALHVQVQFEIESNKARIRQLQVDLDRVLAVLARLTQATGLKTLDEIGDHLFRARDRQFELVAEVESLCRLRLNLERDLGAASAADAEQQQQQQQQFQQTLFSLSIDSTDELRQRIQAQQEVIGVLDQRHHDTTKQLSEISAFLHRNQVPGAEISLEIGLDTLHTRICELVQNAGMQPPNSGPSGRETGPEFNILATSQAQEEDVEQSERIHDASEATRNFLDSLFDQYRRRSFVHGTETLTDDRRCSTASSVQSNID